MKNEKRNRENEKIKKWKKKRDEMKVKDKIEGNARKECEKKKEKRKKKKEKRKKKKEKRRKKKENKKIKNKNKKLIPYLHFHFERCLRFSFRN